MKYQTWFLGVGLVLSTLFGSASWAQPSPSELRNANHHPPGEAAGPSDTDKIRGECKILAGHGNLMPGDCVGVMLVLLDSTGTEVSRTRTSNKGEFEFTARPREKFKILSGSKFYEVVSPNVPIPSGVSLEVDLQQK
jgi:hypothetical protein